MQSRTIARQFLLILSVTFFLVVSFAVRLTYQFAYLSAEGARLIENLQQTAVLNRELGDGNRKQIDELHRQFETLDPLFLTRLRNINYELGEKYAEYLKLDIGEQERMTVENIKGMHSELSILSMQLFEQLRIGSRTEAMARMHRLSQLADLTYNQFEKLNELQLQKLHEIVRHLNRSSTTGYFAICALVGGLILVLAVFIFFLHRSILRPVHELLEASERIRCGDLTARVPVGRMDEIGQMAQGFNFMAESLTESYAGLERKVEERTKQIREMQQQLIQAAKMSALGQLVGGVAHELNNPLQAILGFAELAKMNISAHQGSAKEIQLMEDIDFQVERCRRIVTNLLQFARHQEPHLEAIRINEMVDQILQLRQYELETKNIMLVRELDPDNPVIYADSHKIQQVVLNLLNNAHDAIREADRPGTIWVRTQAGGEKITIEFRDNGTGFRNPERAFDPFYTTKEVGKGTGLGLSVCYGIVQEHRGEIRAGNWEKGAQVIVSLPIGDEKELEKLKVQTPQPNQEPQGERQLYALVVEDEGMLRRLQITYLNKMGIEAAGAGSGDEALSYLQDHNVDIIICDVRMPGGTDGIQVYEWVRENRPELSRRFLFATGDLVELNLGEFFADAGIPHIAKPFRLEDYSRAVRRALESRGPVQ